MEKKVKEKILIFPIKNHIYIEIIVLIKKEINSLEKKDKKYLLGKIIIKI